MPSQLHGTTRDQLLLPHLGPGTHVLNVLDAPLDSLHLFEHERGRPTFRKLNGSMMGVCWPCDVVKRGACCWRSGPSASARCGKEFGASLFSITWIRLSNLWRYSCTRRQLPELQQAIELAGRVEVEQERATRRNYDERAALPLPALELRSPQALLQVLGGTPFSTSTVLLVHWAAPCWARHCSASQAFLMNSSPMFE